MTRQIIFFLIFIGTYANAQHIFSEKFIGCKIDQFSMESEIIQLKISDKEITQTISAGFDDKTKSKIVGTLLMQIIVDTNGNSCLLSLRNKTNIKTSKLNLEQSVNQNLHWKQTSNNICVLVLLTCNKGNISVKRLGLSLDIGLYEITENRVTLKIPPPNSNSSNNPKIIKDKNTKSIWKLYNTKNSMIPKDMSRSIEVDSKGAIWHCTDEGIVKIENDNWTIFTSKNSELPASKYGRTITSGLNIDKKDRVWVESYQSVFMFDGNNWTKFDTTNSPIRNVQDISVDKNGTIWFGTFNGLVKLEDNVWTSFNMKNSKIPSNNVRSVFLDNKNILWVATENGIATFKNQEWKSYNTSNSPLESNSVDCVQGDNNGNIWIGMNEVKGKGGLAKIDSAFKWTAFNTTNSKLPGNTVWDIQPDKNAIWFGLNDGGLVRLEGEEWEIYNTKNSIIPHNFVCSIAIDNFGNKWVATFGGLVFTTR